MPTGRCKGCGKLYFGWALVHSRTPNCDCCGGEIELLNNSPPMLTAGTPVRSTIILIVGSRAYSLN